MKVFVCLSASVSGGKNIDAIVRFIGDGQHTLIYGGGKRGAMGQLSSSLTIQYPSTLQFAYTIPAYAFDVPEHTSKIKVCENLLERLTDMIEAADVAIVCPGGLGTAQELLTLLEWSRTEKRLPVVIINTAGHYNWLVSLIDQWISEGYASSDLTNYYKIVENFDDAVDYLNQFKL
jgi:uncharacterized protein (TIGR00730 family)